LTSATPGRYDSVAGRYGRRCGVSLRKTISTRWLVASLTATISWAGAGVDPLEPGAAIDYGPLAFYPERWKEKKVSTTMVPWPGERTVFLTTTAPLDPSTVTLFVTRIDAAWKLYAETTGQSPPLYRQLGGKPTIAAVPRGDLTCGYGCGMVGATGIELSGFYGHDYPLVLRRPKAFPHYVFYEMGRNFYTFADRHSLFITGYAVFMRYICMDALGCEDPDRRTRVTIEKAEALYAKAPRLRYLQAFTTLDGYDEKKNRLAVSPSDQPVLYASAMLKLHRECGKDEWLKRYYAALAQCPEIKPETKEDALRQSLNWYVAASVAARRDLAPLFCDRWKLPLSAAARGAAEKVPWASPALNVHKALAAVPADFALERK
jgi:hypothetical protein